MPPGEKAVVATVWSRLRHTALQALRKEGVGAVCLEGGVAQVADAIRAFNSDPRVRVLLLALGTDASGLTLTVANHLYILDPVLSPAATSQLIGRICRQSQTRPCYVYHMVAAEPSQLSDSDSSAAGAAAASSSAGAGAGAGAGRTDGSAAAARASGTASSVEERLLRLRDALAHGSLAAGGSGSGSASSSASSGAGAGAGAGASSSGGGPVPVRAARADFGEDRDDGRDRGRLQVGLPGGTATAAGQQRESLRELQDANTSLLGTLSAATLLQLLDPAASNDFSSGR